MFNSIKMKKLILIIVTAFIANYTFGQEEAIYSHVFVNPALINPATVGADRDLDSAGEMLLVERNGVRVGILSCAEHE